MVFACLVIIPSVNADKISIEQSSLKFGGENVEKTDNPIEKSFTLKQSGNETITELTAVFTPLNSFSTFNVKVLAPSSLSGPSVSVKVELTPNDFDVIDEDFEERGEVEVGKLKISGKDNQKNNVVTNEISLFLELENDLEIAEIVLVREDESTKTLSDGSSYAIIEDEDVTLKFKIRNAFSSGGLKIEDVDITVVSEDLDLDEDTSISEVGDHDTEEVEIDLSIDVLKKKEVIVDVEGKDELGGKHGERFSFKFDVEEKDNEPDPDPEPDTNDNDGDGVIDINDLCPNTVSVCSVDGDGCPLDKDDDGICDDLDTTDNGATQKQDQQGPLVNKITKLNKDEDETKSKKEPPTGEDTDSVIPFLIGFVLGICLTAGFFWMIKS